MERKKRGKFRIDLEHYWRGQRKVSRLAEEYIAGMDKDGFRQKIKSADMEIFPCICFSRNIAVGALEVAEIVGERLGYQVVDREIIEYICKKSQLSRKSIATFDERYPGIIKDLMCRILGDRPFGMDDYAKDLFVISYFLASTEPTIFVGRGIHLILPRDRVLAVRCISSKSRRVKRLARTLGVSKQEAEQTLKLAAREQKDFFLKVHGKEKAPTDEFDMILDLDHVREAHWAAQAVEALFRSRFEIQ